MRVVNLDDVHEKKLLVFRRGGGEETTYEIRFAHLRNGIMWGYDTDPIQAKAGSVKELDTLLTEALDVVRNGTVIRAADHISLHEELE